MKGASSVITIGFIASVFAAIGGVAAWAENKFSINDDARAQIVSRVSVVETNYANQDTRLTRIENKVDALLERNGLNPQRYSATSTY